MNIGDRLRRLRESSHLTQEEVAKRIGVTKPTVNRYESGEIDIKRTIAIKLADVLDTTPAYIMGWSDNALPITPPNIIEIKETETYVGIPVIGRVAAGLSCFAENNITDYEPVQQTDITNGEQYAFLRVVGDSMYPEFKEGDLVLVRCQTSVDSGSYAVVIVDDEDGVIKKVVYDKNWIELHSINPMYPVRRFENEDVLRIRVFGLVKQIKRKL